MMGAAVFRTLAGLLSPAGARARLSILIYHRVLSAADPLSPSEPTVEIFDRQMRMLRAVFNVLPLTEAIARLRAGTLPARAASITFDDGYADNLVHAAPVLQKLGLHATFFIATDYLDGGRMFNDTVIEAVRRSPLTSLDLNALGLGRFGIADLASKRQAIQQILPRVKYLPLDARERTVSQVAASAQCGPLPDDLMLSTEQLRRLGGLGMEIGGHTARHPILAKLDGEAARTEIRVGKEFLEHALGRPIRLFAYPNGQPGTDYLPEQAAIVRELGFEGAVSTAWGSADGRGDFFQLPRFTPWATQASRFIPQLLGNLLRR